jgi:hypothetical protein
MFTPLDLDLKLHGWNLSEHARHRLRQRGVPPALLVRTLVDPDISYPHHGQCVLIRGQLSAVVDPTARIVVTLRLNTQGTWSDEAAQAGFAAARAAVTA